MPLSFVGSLSLVLLPLLLVTSLSGAKQWEVKTITEATWEQAKHQCDDIGRGWTVATIHSEAENQHVKKMTNVISWWRWIGLSRLGGEGDTFVWEDGSPASYTNWADNEPNDVGGCEDCVVMLPSGKWNDVPCDSTKGGSFHVACSKEECVGSMCYSDPGRRSSNNHGEAKTICENLGEEWTLASIHTEAQNRYVNNLKGLSDTFLTKWIGLTRVVVGEGHTFVWDGRGPASYKNWEEQQPNNAVGSEDCVQMRPSGEWNGVVCNSPEALEVVCSRINYVCEGTMCYFTDPSSRLYTRDEAKAYCEDEQGWTLASIHSEAQNLLVSELSNEPKWIGLSRVGEDTFVWDDRSPVSLVNWADDEPTNAGDIEDCVQVGVSSDGNWNAVVCEDQLLKAHAVCSRMNYVCEGTMCYAAPPSLLYTRKDAKTYCEGLEDEAGWTLASIHSEAQNLLVSELSNEPKWIGLSRVGEDTFVWDDGSPVSHKKWWAQGQPSNPGSNEDCVAMLGLSWKWSNVECEHPLMKTTAQAVCSGSNYVNECEVGIDDCGVTHYCTDTDFSFKCVPCPLGYKRNANDVNSCSELLPCAGGDRYALGDGYCDGGSLHHNTEECGWDGGDCCESTCAGDNCGHNLYHFPYDCKDPIGLLADAGCDDVTVLGNGICGDGKHGKQVNTEECGWDGGDCCAATCTGDGCGTNLHDYPYDCKDPLLCEGTMCYAAPPSLLYTCRNDAKTYCEGLEDEAGWTLASIHSEAQNLLVSELSNEPKWIGLSRVGEDDTFVWDDGSPVSPKKWWAQGQPGNLGSNEDCVVMWGLTWKWSGVECEHPPLRKAQAVCSRINYVCEGIMCYAAPPSLLYTRKDAKTYCEGLQDEGGWTLASIHSEAQNLLVSELSNEPKWIGLSRVGEDTFVWDDGSPEVSHKNWAQPSNPGSNRDCVAMLESPWKWDMVECEVMKAQAVCSRSNYVNECGLGIDDCGVTQYCTDTAFSFKCFPCPLGYKRNTDDVNSCSEMLPCAAGYPDMLGNGICNGLIEGRFNTKECGWDGGDCCDSTCTGYYCGLYDDEAPYNCKDPLATENDGGGGGDLSSGSNVVEETDSSGVDAHVVKLAGGVVGVAAVVALVGYSVRSRRQGGGRGMPAAGLLASSSTSVYSKQGGDGPEEQSQRQQAVLDEMGMGGLSAPQKPNEDDDPTARWTTNPMMMGRWSC